ncbi:MAG TPA: hypothetical protein EYP03_04600 [Aquificae bacterium]|nr:hypothetical protein [Aquificota bacterium]
MGTTPFETVDFVLEGGSIESGKIETAKKLLEEVGKENLPPLAVAQLLEKKPKRFSMIFQRKILQLLKKLHKKK